MRNWVLAEHLFQVSLGRSRGCPAHPTGTQGQGGAAQCTNADRNYLQRQRKTFAISDALLPLHGYPCPTWLHTSPGQAPRADPHTGQTKSAFPQKGVCRLVLKGWRSPSCAAWVWTQQTARWKPFLPHQIPSSHKLPQEPAFSGSILWSFQLSKEFQQCPTGPGQLTADRCWWHVRAQATAAFRAAQGASHHQQWAAPEAMWLLGHVVI